MAIGIDDLDFGDDVNTVQNTQVTEPNSDSVVTTTSPASNSDIITELLKDRGIEDTTKIKFEDETGNIQERAWSDLSLEEQKEILNQDPFKDPETELDDAETNFINQLRLSGLSPDEYIENLKRLGAQEYAQQASSNSETYEIDDLSDDELFILDLQYRSGDITEEEAVEALKAAKANEALFQKQIAGTREYYRNLERDMKSQQELEQQEENNKLVTEYANQIKGSIQNINSIGNLSISLDDDDKEQLAQFILGRDQAGINWFGKALEDPDTVVRMAWFALNGEDTFNDIENYIAQQIKTTAQNSYNKGYEDGQKGKVNIVVQPTTTNTDTVANKYSPIKAIDIQDLDF